MLAGSNGRELEVQHKDRRTKQKALHREGQEFLVTVMRDLIQFGNECRYSLAPETHIYRSLTQILVGRVLFRSTACQPFKAHAFPNYNSNSAIKTGRVQADCLRVVG
jgi:hypothetical protein